MRQRRWARDTVALVACTWISVAATPQISAAAEPIGDVAGIRLGMTLAEARLALMSIDPRMQVEEFRASAQGIPQFVFALKGYTISRANNGQFGEEGHDIFNLLFSSIPGDDRLIALSRDIRFRGRAEPNSPPAADTASALLAKYGRPDSFGNSSLVSRGGRPGTAGFSMFGFTFVYSTAGALLSLPKDVSTRGPMSSCITSGIGLLNASRSFATQAGTPDPGWSGPFLMTLSPDVVGTCGLMINISVDRLPNNNDLIEHVAIDMLNVTDVIRVYRESNRVASGAARQHQQQEVEQSRQRSPAVRY